MSRIAKLGLIQMTCTNDVDANSNKAVGLIEKAASQGAQIICTQELFKSLYFCQTEDKANYRLAEPVNENSPTVQKLSALASSLRIVLVASLFEKRATGIYHNTAVVLDADGTYLGKYRKMHIPDDPNYYEKYYFTPGDLGYQVFKTRYADIGVLICWDQWYPEAARLLGLKGAEIILIPTAIGHTEAPEGTGYEQAWVTVQRGHAVANVCYLAAVNRVGFEPEPGDENGIQFWGQSFIADPNGELLSIASSDQEENVICPVDLSLLNTIKTDFSFPYRDRRVDSYKGLLKLYSD
jgi:N-carbamoylputrescine amidase